MLTSEAIILENTKATVLGQSLWAPDINILQRLISFWKNPFSREKGGYGHVSNCANSYWQGVKIVRSLTQQNVRPTGCRWYLIRLYCRERGQVCRLSCRSSDWAKAQVLHFAKYSWYFWYPKFQSLVFSVLNKIINLYNFVLPRIGCVCQKADTKEDTVWSLHCRHGHQPRWYRQRTVFLAGINAHGFTTEIFFTVLCRLFYTLGKKTKTQN